MSIGALLLAPLVPLQADTVSPPALFSFFPNQLAGNLWYKPGIPPRLINGHLDGSFGRKELWPNLLKNLKQTHGSFSITAAEIGYLTTDAGLLPLLKLEGIPISVETPGFTQGIDGTLLGNLEINGATVGGANPFASIFCISNVVGRTDPAGVGWFVTRDGKSFIPDELVFDERIPNLLPEFDENLLAHTRGSWEQRKQAARKAGYLMASQPYSQRMATLMQDYVKYLNVAKAHWGGQMPAVSLHWNVNPGWEWRDEKGLDDIYAKTPAYFNVPENYRRIIFNAPQYNSVQYLNQLIDVLTAAGFKPKTVFMDVDWTYSIPYITEVLKRHKAALRSRGVQMSINLVEAGIGDQEELYCEGNNLKKRSDPQAAPNILYENTLISIMKFLKSSGIYERGMQMRVGSWSHRPHEVGAQINEDTHGSMAHAANEIVNLLQEFGEDRPAAFIF